MSDNSKGETDLLDRALRDLSAEQRARVLDLTIRLNIDRDDPLWLICLAIGQLQVLVEDAPAEWKGTFEAFSSELEAWTASNLKVLGAITQQAEAGADLAEISKKLTDTLSDLTKLLSAPSKPPPSLTSDTKGLQKKLASWRADMTRQTASIKESLETLRSAVNMRNSLTSSLITDLSVTRLGIVALMMLNGAALYFLWTAQQKNQQQLQWLLYKANRQECVAGIVAKSAPQCQPFKH